MAPLVKKCHQRPLKPVKRVLYTTKLELGGRIVLHILLPKIDGRAGPIWFCAKKSPDPSF